MSSEGASTLGAHLGEMDRLLRDIQAELLPDREPAPALTDASVASAADAGLGAAFAPPPAAAPRGSASATTAAAPSPNEQLQALAELATRLVASMRELLAGYERVVAQTSALPPARRRRMPSAPPRAPDVTLSAGPFPSLQGLRDFERAVSGLPGVREVAVQAYEGSDRAIIEVRLDHPNP